MKEGKKANGQNAALSYQAQKKFNYKRKTNGERKQRVRAGKKKKNKPEQLQDQFISKSWLL